MSQLYSNSIFWIEVKKIKPNPYQPRKEFDEGKLQELADSVRQYGVLQPLVVSRVEIEKDDGLTVEYELIAGERRLRAAKIAGLEQIPAIIRTGDDSKMKLEMAIIENLQREDLNPVDRARAFMRLADEFDFTHNQIGKKVGKSREYISNSLRLLSLPQEIMDALAQGKITEGHTRPIMMLNDKPQEQITLFKEIFHKRLTVREAESIARKIAHDKIRKRKNEPDPAVMELEGRLSERLGTRVSIEKKEVGGKIMIDYFSNEDLETIMQLFEGNGGQNITMLENFIKKQEAENSQRQENEPEADEEAKDEDSFTQEPDQVKNDSENIPAFSEELSEQEEKAPDLYGPAENFNDHQPAQSKEKPTDEPLVDDRTSEEVQKSENEDDDDMYFIKNFNL